MGRGGGGEEAGDNLAVAAAVPAPRHRSPPDSRRRWDGELASPAGAVCQQPRHPADTPELQSPCGCACPDPHPPAPAAPNSRCSGGQGPHLGKGDTPGPRQGLLIHIKPDPAPCLKNQKSRGTVRTGASPKRGSLRKRQALFSVGRVSVVPARVLPRAGCCHEQGAAVRSLLLQQGGRGRMGTRQSGTRSGGRFPARK